MSETPRFDFDAKTGKGSGMFKTANGALVPFLPDVPANSPPYELIVTEEADEKSADGFRHYLIGGVPETVSAIVAWYESQGKVVPAGFEEEAALHHAAVQAEKANPGDGARLRAPKAPPAS